MKNKIIKLLKDLGEILDVAYELFDKLPTELRVTIYVTISAGLGELAKELMAIETNSLLLTFIINIALVFIKNLRPRIKTRNEKNKSAN